MKIYVLSDLHLEFQPYTPDPAAVAAADVIVLAGDISLNDCAIGWISRWFKDKPVIYVAGNHEFYGGHIDVIRTKLAANAREWGIHYLENQKVVISGVRFLGATLWTDFELLAMRKRSMDEAGSLMRDFRVIRYGNDLLTPKDTVALHMDSLGYLQRQLAEPFAGKTVVVTHHAPSFKSIQPQFENSAMSAAFASNQDGLVGRADVWIHGHTHFSQRYQIGKCTVISNQRGYVTDSHAKNTGFQDSCFVEV